MAFDQQIFSTALDKNLIQMKHIVSLIILLNLTPFEKPGPGQHKLTIDWEKQTQPEKNQNRTHFKAAVYALDPSAHGASAPFTRFALLLGSSPSRVYIDNYL